MIKRNRTTRAPVPNETISKQSRGFSAQRNGRETFRVAFRHDRVEESPRASFELMTGVVLIEPGSPRMKQSPPQGTRERKDACHAQSMAHDDEKNIGHSPQKFADVLD